VSNLVERLLEGAALCVAGGLALFMIAFCVRGVIRLIFIPHDLPAWADDAHPRPSPEQNGSRGFPVRVEPLDHPTEDAPGVFRVVGVDRRTGEDTLVSIAALTLANAKVKAELRGIVVTRMTRLPPDDDRADTIVIP
jgi:hypothetical protein